MKTSTLVTIFFSSAVTADVVPAIRRAPTPGRLDKRQMCDINYPLTCSAVDGDFWCMAVDEVCCQLILPGVDAAPFICPASHPYCCPPDASGMVGCGVDDMCGAVGFLVVDNQAPTHGLATQTAGVKPTNTAAAKTVTQATTQTQTTGAGAEKTVTAQPPSKTNAADHVSLIKGRLAAAVFGVVALL